MIAQSPDSTFFAEIQRKLPLFLTQYPEAQRGALTMSPAVVRFFGDVPEPTLMRYLAEFGCLGETAQLDVLVPLYLALRPRAMCERKPIAELTQWLRGKGCMPTMAVLLKFLEERNLRLGQAIYSPILVATIASILGENVQLFDRPLQLDGPDGFMAQIRQKVPDADQDEMMSVLALYPLKFAGRVRPAPKHRPVERNEGVEFARTWLADHPEDPVILAGPNGFIAAMAKGGVPIRGAAADAMVRSLGRKASEPMRVTADEVKDVLRCLLGDSIKMEMRKISGIDGLTHRVLELGLDAGPDVVKRCYVELGGRVMPCPKEQGDDYRKQLPKVLQQIRLEHPEFSQHAVPVRGKGGLKELVWAKGVQANHETIRKYAEELGFTLTKARAA